MIKKISDYLKSFWQDSVRLVYSFGPIKRYRRKQQLKKIGVVLLYAVLLYVVVVLISVLFYIGSLASVINYSLKGKSNLEAAVNYSRTEDYGRAIVEAQKAKENLAIAQKSITKMHDSIILSSLPAVNNEIEDIYNLLTAVELLSRAMSQGIIFVGQIKEDLESGHSMNYSKFTVAEKSRIIDRIYKSGPELNGLKANVDMANVHLNRLAYRGVLLPFKSKLLEVKDYLEVGSKTLKIAVPMSEVLPLIAGHPNNSTILVLMQNQDELRPTGGFVGTYGILETSKGDIERFETHDVYHMDMPVRDKLTIAPPAPLRDYLNKKWYFRDANWSPDWPTASRKMQDFYHLENKLLTGKNQINNFDGEFTGVMAISPNMVVRLLRIVGPIQIGDDKYDAENFSRLLEYKVEQGFVADGVPAWQRKEVIGEIVKELKIRLFDLPFSRFSELVDVVDQGLTERDLLLYFNNPVAQKTMLEKGWAGEIKQTSSDYLFHVDANLASLKTDSVMTRDYNYKIDQKTGFAKFSVTYHHGSVRTDWRTSAYKTYMRLYVPLGAQLTKVEGARTEAVVLTENNRTNFGVLVNVAPGQSKTVSFYYKVPAKYLKGEYGLYVQKQPNIRLNKLVIDVLSRDKVKSFSPTTSGVELENNRVFWQTRLTRDSIFQVNK